MTSDAYDDELPYWTNVAGKPHLVVPYSMSTNDSKFGRGTFGTGDDFFHYCRDAFDFLYAEGRTQPKMLSIGLHMRLIGHPARAAGLQRLLDHIGRFRWGLGNTASGHRTPLGDQLQTPGCRSDGALIRTFMAPNDHADSR